VRYFKISILTLGILLMLAISASITIVFFYENEVKAYVLSEINKKLNTRVIVDTKNIRLHLLRSFPYASLDFNNVTALDAVEGIKKDTLFNVAKISLQFNLIDIINKNYRIRKIELSDGTVNLKVDKKGADNYHFWKTTSDTTNSGFTMIIEKIIVKNILLNYLNTKTNSDCSFIINRSDVSGHFSDAAYSLQTEMDLTANRIENNGTDYINRKDIGLTLNLDVSKNNYKIVKGKIKIAGLNFEIAGETAIYENSSQSNLKMKGKDMNIQSILSLLPANYKSKIKDYESEGNFYFESSLRGDILNTENVVIKANFGITDGRISYTKSGVQLHEVNLTGLFVKDNLTNSLRVEKFSAKLKESSVKGNFSVVNFPDPRLTLSASADVNLAELQDFLRMDTIETITGSAKLNFNYLGKIPNFKKYSGEELKKINTSGDLTVINSNIRLKNNPLRFDSLNALFTFDNNDIRINEFSGSISQSDFSLNGFLKNVFAYLLSDHEQLTITATLKSKTINLDELLQNKKINVKTDTAYSLRFSPFINLDLNSEVSHLKFRKFAADNIRGTITLKDKQLLADPLSFSTMDGSIIITNGIIDAGKSNKILISCDANLKQININKLFNQFENFGQNVIVDKNLKGSVTADIQFASIWSSDLTANLDKIYVRSNFTIEKGELINFESLKSLSKFIEISELADVKFSTLTNQIEIKNQKIYIPKMEVNSSALNITTSGTHAFNNDIDYKIKLSLNDLLSKKARKAKKENSEFGVVEDDGLGRTALYLSMTGNADNPVIKYDRKSAMTNLKKDFKSEKQNLKTILHDAFGWFKKDSSAVIKKQDEKKKGSKFNVKWDENDANDKKKDEKDEDF